MITYLLYKLVRKFLANQPGHVRNVMQYLKSAFKVLLVILSSLSFLNSPAQEFTLAYEMTRNSKIIGSTVVKTMRAADKVTYRINTDIRFNLIKDFHGSAIEETVFEKGIMVSSFVHRTLNGETKSKKKTRLIDSVYQVEIDGKMYRLNLGPVNHTISSLYLNEPINTRRIFSDTQQRWLEITPVKPHIYKIVLPDGNYTIYHFRNGICYRIDIFQTLVNLRLMLINESQYTLNTPLISSN
jgi:hypothetical protein